MKIMSIYYNWYATVDGENYSAEEVGRNNVKSIEKGPGYYRVFYAEDNFSDFHSVFQVNWSSED